MTPNQHYFPYFFQLDTFNKELKTFGLSSLVTYDSKTQLPNTLLITQLGATLELLSIPFGATIMIQDNNLFYWQTDYDRIDIKQIALATLAETAIIQDFKIDLLRFSLGRNHMETKLDLNDLVTFVRKKDLKYDQDYYDQFVIVLLDKQVINIIPFDWFNKNGGDYGYVWPAIAKLDKKKCKLYGQGMRMKDFTIELEESCLSNI
jgi:hypothetical protein